MSAEPAFARRGFLAAALARAEAWLLEPVEGPDEAEQPSVSRHAVVAVFGLGERCGVTTVARALGAELAARDPGGACAVSATARSAALPLGSAAAGRLARTLGAIHGARAHASGRLCLVDCSDLARLADAVRYTAPLVLDLGRTAVGGAPAALADQVVLVASPSTPPALASVAAESLRAPGRPIVALNRVPPDGGDWAGGFDGIADLVLPASKVGAQFAQAGREPRGELGRAITELADRCEAAAGA